MAAVYVSGDARGIQGYIFGSPRLLEMRGASALIDFFDRAVVPALIEEHNGEAIFSGGGNFLAKLEGDEAKKKADQLADAARHAFLDLVGTSGLTVVQFESDKPFAEAQAELAAEVRRAKRSPTGVEALASMPFLKRCESCGRESADVGRGRPGAEPDAEPQWLGPICARKRLLHNELRTAANAPRRRQVRWGVHGITKGLVVPFVNERLGRASLPRDFKELTGEEDLALVVADGNGLGEWFTGLDEATYRELSRQIDEKLRRSLDAATEAAFPGETRPDLQVLICGGDDLVVALPAGRALPFVERLVAEFRILRPGESHETTGMSAGLVYCRTGFPFRRAHHLAEELLRRAKAGCREKGWAYAVDFHRVLGSHVQSLERERATVERMSEESEGWSYGAAGPYGPEGLASLVDLAGTLRREVSATQRGRLREILSPRDDGRESPLDPTWRVPIRVIAELEHWLARQEEAPFELPDEGVSEELLGVERQTRSDGRSRTMRRWKLSDALMLAEYVEV